MFAKTRRSTETIVRRDVTTRFNHPHARRERLRRTNGFPHKNERVAIATRTGLRFITDATQKLRSRAPLSRDRKRRVVWLRAAERAALQPTGRKLLDSGLAGAADKDHGCDAQAPSLAISQHSSFDFMPQNPYCVLKTRPSQSSRSHTPRAIDSQTAPNDARFNIRSNDDPGDVPACVLPSEFVRIYAHPSPSSRRAPTLAYPVLTS